MQVIEIAMITGAAQEQWGNNGKQRQEQWKTMKKQRGLQPKDEARSRRPGPSRQQKTRRRPTAGDNSQRSQTRISAFADLPLQGK
jgi:hypothetical protein